MKNGMIVSKDGDVLNIDSCIVDLANELETKLQKARYLAAQPKATPHPSLDGFVRKSENDIELFKCDTPILDAKNLEALEFMDEIDQLSLSEKMNDMLLGMKELVMFVKDDEVISMHEGMFLHKFDTPLLGNPLEWSEPFIANVVAEIHGCEVVHIPVCNCDQDSLLEK